MSLKRRKLDLGEGTKLYRVMSPDDVKERDQLNRENTASALRARVLAHHAQLNGHSTELLPLTGREFS